MRVTRSLIGNNELRTPNIDHLAKTGVVFANAFTPIPVCSPARASFFTGLLASQHGVHDYIAAAAEFHDTDWLDGLDTLPKLLSSAGYRCGFSGKWHLGQDENVQAGFDDWFALSGDYPIEHKGDYRYSNNGRIVKQAGYKTQYIADRTVDFLRRQDPKRPFFHFTSFYATHSPWAGQPERLVEQYRDCTFADIPSTERVFDGQVLNIERQGTNTASNREACAQYYASVGAIDEAVGRILDELEAIGTADNTLIIYTSDHGLCLGHHGIWGKGNATSPQNMIEESIRIPMILAGAGRLAPGTRRSEFADHLDLFKTVLDATEVSSPAHAYAGESLLPLARGTNVPWRDAQFGEYGPARMIRTDRYKYIRRYDNNPSELFDLSTGTGEGESILMRDGAEKIAEQLEERLTQHFLLSGCPPPDIADSLTEKRFNNAEAWR